MQVPLMFVALLAGFSAKAIHTKNPCGEATVEVERPKDFKAWQRQAAPPFPLKSLASTDPNLEVLIIGGGPAGLGAGMALKRAGIRFRIAELHTQSGGMWDITNPRSVAYPTLMTNSWKGSTHLNTPVPKDYPDFLSHEKALEYLHWVEREYQLNSHFRFQTRVEWIEKKSNAWAVTLRDLKTGDVTTENFRAVVLASGLHNTQSTDFPKELWTEAAHAGLHVSHTATYRFDKPDLIGKKAMFIGLGNSSSDIATDLCPSAEVFVSVRSTPWFVPLRALGKPAERVAGEGPYLPHWLEMWLFHRLQRHYVGHPTTLGFPPPDHDLLEKMPVSDRGFVQAVKDGKIQVRPEIVSIGTDGVVHYRDDLMPPEKLDACVFGTGYKQRYPFLSREYFDPDDTSQSLPFLLFHRTEPGLFFLMEAAVPQGGWPLLAMKGDAVAAYLTAEEKGLPSIATFNALRQYAINPDFKGTLFRKEEGENYVDPKRFEKIYNALIESFER